MTTVRACEGCQHSSLAPLDHNNFAAVRPLVCRRYPPTVSTVVTPDGQGMVLTNFPQVPPGGVCGEWSPAAPVLAS